MSAADRLSLLVAYCMSSFAPANRWLALAPAQCGQVIERTNLLACGAVVYKFTRVIVLKLWRV